MSHIASVGNPRAAHYAGLARQSASRGSKRFVFTVYGDDLQPFPSHYARFAWDDNPLKGFWTWVRYRWLFHDFRMFGLKETLKKQYYMGEAWRRRDERIFCGKDENGNKYWVSRKNGAKMGGRLFEPVDPHWFRGQDGAEIPPGYAIWWQYNRAFTPAQEKARGEHGPHTHSTTFATPWRIKWTAKNPTSHGNAAIFDPWMSHQPGMLWCEHQPVIKEAGYSGWTTQVGRPSHTPFFGEHDIPEDTVLAYWRRIPFHMKSSHSIDGDEWRVA